MGEKVLVLEIRKIKVIRSTCSTTPQTSFVVTFCVGHLKSIYLYLYVFLFLSLSLSFLRGKANNHTLVEDILV